MESSDTLIDSLAHYLINHLGTTKSTEYSTRQGNITYYADYQHPFTGQCLMIYSIDIKPDLQHTGIFKTYIAHVVTQPFDRVEVLAICNGYLDEYLHKIGWVAHGADRYLCLS